MPPLASLLYALILFGVFNFLMGDFQVMVLSWIYDFVLLPGRREEWMCCEKGWN